MSKKKRVVIVGAGFGGLACARELCKGGENVEVTIIDKHSYQLFSPLLYQVATGGLPEDDIAYPVRAAVESGVKVKRGEVVFVDVKRQLVRLADSSLVPFDDLVVSVGSVGESFGVVGVEEHALQMKSIRDARKIRQRLFQAYEDVELGVAGLDALKVVVVGGGPTGVELAGAIAELQKGMARDYSEDMVKESSVVLVEAGDRVLSSFSVESSEWAKRELEEIGVEVMVSSPVEKIYDGVVRLKSGEVLNAGTIIWAAGVAVEPKWKFLGDSDRLNRLHVDEFLRVDPHVWVVGDAAYFTVEDKPLPMVAPVAIQMGKHVAKQIIASCENREFSPFKYVDKGQMATIGRRRGIVELPNGLKFHGTLAWLMWLALHVFYLAGGRNRVSVIVDWIWNYITWGLGPRRTVLD